jgi:hypothetical protein
MKNRKFRTVYNLEHIKMKRIVMLLVILVLSDGTNLCAQEPQKSDRGLSSPRHSKDPCELSSPVLTWLDADTGTVLFTVDDIIVFDWENQVFELKLYPALDFLAWTHGRQYRNLVVTDRQGIIYTGTWVSPISSMGFRGPTYHSMGANTVFCISDGYGGGQRPPQRDVNDSRFSDRLYKEIKRTGRLGTIANIKTVGNTKILELSKTYDYKRINIINQRGSTCGKDLKIGLEYFANTFNINGEARAHIFFWGGDKTQSYINDIDEIVLEIKLTSNEGRFRSDVRVENISPMVIRDGIYVCQFRPWNPLPGSQPAEPGTGYVSLSIILRKTTKNGPKTICRLDFPEQTVDIQLPYNVDAAVHIIGTSRTLPQDSKTTGR